MTRVLKDQSGVVLITVALLLVALIGFIALGMEVGRWYLVRAELSKAVDAGALAGAKNISNPNVDPVILAQEMGYENFAPGYVETPTSGAGAISIKAAIENDKQVRVTGTASAIAILARLFGIEQVATASQGVAQKNDVEIMLVLDRSTSMAGQPIANLKVAAKSFLDYFKDTQKDDRLGLISFATDVTVDAPLGNNFYDKMSAAIQGLKTWDPSNLLGDTNTPEGIEKAGGPQGLQDQGGLAPADRRSQFIIFFTDGQPTAFRGSFLYNGTAGDLVAEADGTCRDMIAYYDPVANIGQFGFLNTGDGLPAGSSVCGGGSYKWNSFLTYPLAGHGPQDCGISEYELGPYICDTARKMAIKDAQVLKDRGVLIYIIGLGNLDQTFLHQVASGTDFEYYAPTSKDLQAIFNKIAKDIKLRLVQ